MNYIASTDSAVKPKFGDTPGERDLVMSAIRVAVAETKLVANELETIGASLRQRAITCEGALKWADQKGLLHLINFGPSKAEDHWRHPGWQEARDEYHANRRAKS